MKRGFTLVELSIVLVIIGLLIGGILVAQSMIATANITATVKQIQQFDAGVEAFKTRYGYLPGDAPAFGGDGNGWVTLSGTDANACFAGENANFWNQINSTAFPNTYPFNSVPGAKAVSTGANANVPAAKIGKAGAFFWAGALGTGDGGTPLDTSHGNYYAILDGTTQMQNSNDGFCFGTVVDNGQNEALTPVELLALDTKMDDGVANTGYVISGTLNDGPHWPIYPNYPNYSTNGYCNNSGTYLLTGTHAKNHECTPLIQIGGQAGDPQ